MRRGYHSTASLDTPSFRTCKSYVTPYNKDSSFPVPFNSLYTGVIKAFVLSRWVWGRNSDNYVTTHAMHIHVLLPGWEGIASSSPYNEELWQDLQCVQWRCWQAGYM